MKDEVFKVVVMGTAKAVYSRASLRVYLLGKYALVPYGALSLLHGSAAFDVHLQKNTAPCTLTLYPDVGWKLECIMSSFNAFLMMSIRGFSLLMLDEFNCASNPSRYTN